MWIMTTGGFLSIVKKPEDTKTPYLTVRARARRDLETFTKFCKRETMVNYKIEETPKADYRFRCRVPDLLVAQYLFSEARIIDYSNFKSEVHTTMGHDRAEIYANVWHALYHIQSRE